MKQQFSPTLRISHVSADFNNGHGRLEVLHDIHFDVNQSEFVCILGPSGSGKSTLLRILGGLLPASSGRVELDGREVTEPRRGVGIVFQDANLMPWRTALENICLPLELQNVAANEVKKKAQELIELVGLTDFEDSLPINLSGGMAQRVAIARALVHDPELLLLDEPFGALDAITRERMGEELLRIWRIRNKTVVMVTHDISEALFLADRVLVLKDQPASIQLDMQVDLPRPRKSEMRYTQQFGKLSKQLRNAIA
ncbi:MAG: ABC transporter ATP-binding protein [Chloroflexota bacterium]